MIINKVSKNKVGEQPETKKGEQSETKDGERAPVRLRRRKDRKPSRRRPDPLVPSEAFAEDRVNKRRRAGEAKPKKAPRRKRPEVGQEAKVSTLSLL